MSRMVRETRSLDDALIALLRADGRASISMLARQLGMPRPVVRERLKQLLQEGHVSVTAVADPAVLGLRTMCHLAVHVHDSPSETASALAGLADTSLVTITSGPHDLVVEVRSLGQREMYEAIARIRALPGVSHVTTLLYVDVHKSPYSSLTTRPQRTMLDAIDERIIGILQTDGRVSFTAIGHDVGISESTARARLKRLVDDHVIRITAVAKRNAVTHSLALGMGINVAGDTTQLIADLTRRIEVEFVATSIGAFDLLATLSADSLEALQRVIDDVRAVPSVTRVESWMHLTIVKELYSAPEGLTALTSPALATPASRDFI